MSDEERNTKLFEMVTHIKTSNERIERALFGEEGISEGALSRLSGHDIYITALKQEGIIQKTQENQKYIERDKKLKNRIAGGVAVGTPIVMLAWDRFLHWIGWK